MSLYGFAPGYFIYILVIFLPGIGFGELLGIFNVTKILSEKIAIAFGMGISVDTLVFLVKTSKIGGLVGINLETVYFILLIGIIALVVSLVKRKGRLSIIARPTGVDLAMLLIILIQGGILLLYFQKFPIFPQSQSQDFANHVNYVLGLISGTVTSIPQGLLYFGVHYQLAASYLLVGGEALVTDQRTMAILMTLSPLLFFVTGKKLFSDSVLAGLITATAYIFTGTIWYTGPIDAGLYPNFFGIMAAMTVLFSLLLLTSKPNSPGLWTLFVLALVNGYMSHYTFVTLLPAILILPILKILKLGSSQNVDRKLWKATIASYVLPVAVMLLPVTVPLLLYPSIGKYALYLATNGGGVIIGPTFLSNALSFFPFLHYLAIEVHDDFALIILLLLSVYSVYKGIASRDLLAFIPITWLLALAATAPLNPSAWRFSYEATVPLTLLACYATYELVADTFGIRKRSGGTVALRIKGRTNTPKLSRAFVVGIILLGAIVVGGIGTQTIAGSITSTHVVAQSQRNVYDAITWLGTNTPNSSKYLSVSDWRFQYTSTMIDRFTYYTIVISNVGTAISLARNVSAQYIIVTNLVTGQIPQVASEFPWNNFPTSSNSNLTLVYTNPDVRIYSLV